MENKLVSELQALNVVDVFTYFNKVVDERVKNSMPLVPEDRYQSDDLSLLVIALSEAKLHIKPIVNDKQNIHADKNYSSLAALYEEINDPLARASLTILQPTRYTQSGELMLHTKLYHSSGQWIESRLRLVPTKDDYQGFGSATDFSCRTQIITLLNLAVIDDEFDDDAEYAQSDFRNAKIMGLTDNFKTSKHQPEPIHPKELAILENELQGYPEIAKNILKTMKLQSLADFPSKDFETGLKKIRTFKANLEAAQGIKS